MLDSAELPMLSMLVNLLTLKKNMINASDHMFAMGALSIRAINLF